MNCCGYLEGVNGVKTGFTNGAGRCLVTSVSRNNFDIIVVVLGADTKKIRTRDSIKLIEYTYKNYELFDLQEFADEEFNKWRDINEGRIKTYKGKYDKMKTILGELQYNKYPIEKNKIQDIWIDIDFKDYFEAPVKEKTKIGNMKIGINTTEITSVEVLCNNKIERKSVLDYWKELVRMYVEPVICNLFKFELLT